jgi:hypothetical protein
LTSIGNTPLIRLRLIFNLKDFFDVEINGCTFYDRVRQNWKLNQISTDKESLKLLYIKFFNTLDKAIESIITLGWPKGISTDLMI